MPQQSPALASTRWKKRGDARLGMTAGMGASPLQIPDQRGTGLGADRDRKSSISSTLFS
jgi:hypothetical protein